MTVQEILKQEFENVEISGKASDLSKSLNIFSRKIQAIVNDCPAERISIMEGNGGKFVWIQYADDWDTMTHGGVASGNIEDGPIHYDGLFFDDINYSKISFALIPVEDSDFYTNFIFFTKEVAFMSEYQRLLACPEDEANIVYEEFISHLDDELFE